MRLVIPALENHIGARVARDFEECAHFLLFENGRNIPYQIIPNPYLKIRSGADIFCAQLLIQIGIDAMITSGCSANALRIFHEAGIKIYLTGEVTVTEALLSHRSKGDAS